jgi:hypothetical protein
MTSSREASRSPALFAPQPAVLVWIRLAEIARQTCRTLYQVNRQMLDDFLRQQLKNPSLRMKLA